MMNRRTLLHGLIAAPAATYFDFGRAWQRHAELFMPGPGHALRFYNGAEGTPLGEVWLRSSNGLVRVTCEPELSADAMFLIDLPQGPPLHRGAGNWREAIVSRALFDELKKAREI